MVFFGSASPRVPVFVTSTQPSTPITGDLWQDTSTTPPVLKAWDGSSWNSVVTTPAISLINTYNPNAAASFTISDAALATYRFIKIVINGAASSTANLTMTINNDSGAHYDTLCWFNNTFSQVNTATSFFLCEFRNNGGVSDYAGEYLITANAPVGAANRHSIVGQGIAFIQDSGQKIGWCGNWTKTDSSITRLDFAVSGAQTFTGQVKIYGVN